METSPEVEAWIQEEAEKLDTYYGRTTSCRVIVETPHSHHRSGNPYHVRIDLGVPGEELVVKHQPSLHGWMKRVRELKRVKRLDVQAPHKDLHLTIRDAFNVARRQLEDYARRRRGEVKTPARPARGRVSKIFPERGFGFVETADGREIYFHRDSIRDGKFNRLKVGREVAFAEESGEKGPQASTVKLSVGRGRSLDPRMRRKPL